MASSTEPTTAATSDVRPQSVTIREVAAQADVSQATAARALGGYGYVSATARRRVEDAATELGYRPNDVARALASGSTKTIGLIVGDIENPFFAALARGVANAVEAEGYTLLLANSDEDIGHERRAVEAFRTRLIDGLIIAPVTGTEALHLRREERPIVFVDRAIRGLPVDTVTVTNAQGAAAATAHLISLGHRRIGVVTDSPEIHSTAQRLRGYRSALRAAGLAVDESLISYGASTQEGGYGAALRLLGRADRPHAVFTTSNFMTVGAVRALHELGLKMPDDAALVAFDDQEWMTLVEPNITVVAQPVVEIGETAGQLLLARLAGGSEPPRRVRLATELIVRASCGTGRPTAGARRSATPRRSRTS